MVCSIVLDTRACAPPTVAPLPTDPPGYVVTFATPKELLPIEAIVVTVSLEQLAQLARLARGERG